MSQIDKLSKNSKYREVFGDLDSRENCETLLACRQHFCDKTSLVNDLIKLIIKLLLVIKNYMRM